MEKKLNPFKSTIYIFNNSNLKHTFTLLETLRVKCLLTCIIIFSILVSNAQTTITSTDGYLNAVRYNFTGADQTFTVPVGIDRIQIKAWGAGGGSEGFNGGAGGYTEATLPVTAGQTYRVIVGERGKFGLLATIPVSYGFGGQAGSPASGHGSGGGLSGLFTDPGGVGNIMASQSSLALVVAGGGGGGNTGGVYNAAGRSGNVNSGITSDMQGATVADGGSGGGGYRGGAIGRGGIGFVTSLAIGSYTQFSATGTTNPPNTADPQYVPGLGTGSSGTGDGTDGMVVVQWGIAVEVCDNSIDDDGDGLTDCEDPDCALDNDCFSCDAVYTTSTSLNDMVAGDIIWQAVTPDAGYNRAVAYLFTGSDQRIVVPDGVTEFHVKAWGAGGGTEGFRGGAGGFSEGTFNVTPGDTYSIMVGERGIFNILFVNEELTLYGFSGQAGTLVVGSGTGGGLTGFFTGSTEIFDTDTDRALVVAGGGGGGNTSGIDNSYGTNGNTPGGLVTTTLRGQTVGDGGAGGGGYFGGANGAGTGVAGHGGQGFVHSSATSSSMEFAPFGSITPPRTTDVNYIGDFGMGISGTNGDGKNGLMVIQWLDTTDSFQLDGVESVACQGVGIYAVSVTVQNGVAPYTVTGTGAPGTWVGDVWTSDPISDDVDYNINIEDSFGCDTINIMGNAPICVEICDNGIDDDGDNLIDCNDPDCSGYEFLCNEGDCNSFPDCEEGALQEWVSNATVGMASPPIAGDIDLDGTVEIIMHGPGLDTGNGISLLRIFNASDGTLERDITLPANTYFAGAVPVIGNLIKDDPEAEIVVPLWFGGGVARYYCYDHNGSIEWISPNITSATGSGFARVALGMADINQDGQPEVYGANVILNGADGTIAASGPASPQGFVDLCWDWVQPVAIDALPDTFCVNCDGMEIVAGNTVYSVNMTSGTFNAEVTAATGNDGHASIADIDKDGDIDAVVTTLNSVYAWDLQTSTVLGNYTSGVSHPGPASIADYDGDGEIDIVFHTGICTSPGLSNSNVISLENDFSLKWSKTVQDPSGTTALIGFDFEGDGKTEVFYNDEDTFYILDGTDGSTKFSFPNPYGTGLENAIVIDADNDDQAEVIHFGNSTSSSTTANLVCWGSNACAWPTTRKVWNQKAFMNFNILDDLNIPTVQPPQHLMFDSVKYNTFLTAAIFVNETGDPVYLQPDATITIDDITCSSGNITYTISNLGDTQLPSGTSISFYDADPTITSANLIATISSPIAVDSGTTETNLNGNIGVVSTPDIEIYAVINDDGSLATPYNLTTDFPITTILECDYTNNISAMITCPPEICDNGLDDDGDGLTDCEDPDCYLVSNTGGTDNDSDGIDDNCDLDDDNDGIPDAIEDYCPSQEYVWPTWTSNTTGNVTLSTGQNVTIEINPAPGILSLDPIYEPNNFLGFAGYASVPWTDPNPRTQWNAQVSTINFSVPVVDPVIILSSIGDATTPVGIAFDTPYVVEHDGGNTFFSSPTTLTGQEGFAILKFPGIHSSLDFSCTNTEFYTSFTWGLFAGPCNDDYDGDNIVNSLDTDSDGDLCPDAEEAGHGLAVLPDDTVGGAYGNNGLVNSQEDVDDSSAVITYTLSENTAGSFDFLNENFFTCPMTEICNNGLDDDGDGLIDCDDPDCYLVSNTGGTDYDGDGIDDVCDLDDDNDGILDTDECGDLNNTEFGGAFGELITGARRDLDNPPGGVYVYAATGEGNDAGEYAVLTPPLNPDWHPAALPLVGHTTGDATDAFLAVNGAATVGTFYNETVDIEANQQVEFGLSAANWTGVGDNPIIIMRVFDATGTTELANVSTGSIPGDLNWYSVSGTFNTLTNTQVIIRVENFTTSGNGNDFAIDDVYINYVNSTCVNIDTDGDGVFDHLDIDSDNDGIYDIQESGQLNNGAIDADNNGIIDGAPSVFGGNGLFDGIETDDTSSATVNTASVDTDGDNVIDAQDLDSDADSCSDANEAYQDNNADGLDDGQYGNGLPAPTNANGTVSAASYQIPDTSYQTASAANICAVDSDGDNVPDVTDIDDDNDGILDSDECFTHVWATPPVISGNTATGTIGGVNYTYTSSEPITSTTEMFGHNRFPPIYNVPNDNPTIQNSLITNNTLTFDSPILNPLVIIASIGDPLTFVNVEFTSPVEIIFSENVTINSSTSITGNEGFVIARFNGIYSSVGFNYLDAEFYANFAFGGQTVPPCDTDGDGVFDYLDLDSDNDGIYDLQESGQLNNGATDGDNNGVIDGVPADFGANGLFNGIETDDTASGTVNIQTLDTDGDNSIDSIELDADNDGCSDSNEAYADADADGTDDGQYGLGNPAPSNGNGLVTAASYQVPADGDTNSVYDFQEANQSLTSSTQPADQLDVLLGSNATFMVTPTTSGTGAVNVAYQWQENDGTGWTNIADGGVYSGAMTDTLTLTGVTLAMDGNLYRVVVMTPSFICDNDITTNDATLTVLGNPSVNLTKMADVSSVEFAGDIINYTISIENDGDVELSNIMVSDPLISLTGPGATDLDGDNILDTNETWIYTGSYVVTQTDIDNNGGGDGDIDNTVTVSGDAPMGAPTFNDAMASEEVDIFNSQMSVIKVGTLDDGGDGLNAGDVINYVITITNTGNTTLTNISIADPGATITSGTPIADLGPGAVATINANHVLTQPEIDSGSYSNQATVTYDDHNGTTLTNDSDDPSDGTDADNADTEPNNDPDDPTDIDLSGLQDSQMSVIKVGTLDDGGDGLNAGDVINYVITITNTGNTTLTNISIADPGATITSGTPIADLGPGAVATINANHVLTQPEIDSGSYSNQATVTYDDHNGTTLTNDSDDPSDGTDADNADTEPNNDPDDPTDIDLSGLQDSQMSVIKVGTLDDGGDGLNAGDVINYVITITNTGNTTLTNISIADPGATITSGTPIADLGPGAVATINANHVLTQPEIDSGSYSNQATVTYDDHNGTTLTNDSDDPSDGTDADNADTEPNNDPDDPTDIDLSGLQDSQMSVIKVGTLDDGGDGLNAGDVINYVITITNTGNTTLTNISIADPGATITSGTPIADLGPGAVATINANHVLTQPEIDSGSYSNQATVTYDDHNGTTLTNDSDDPSDGTDADNADTEPNNDPDDPTDIDLSGLQDSQMSVIKVGTLDDGGDGLNAGDVINYVITITNTGNTTLTNISIADPGATITSGTPITDLGPGAVATINANHVLTQPEIDSGSYSNQATVTYDDHNGTTLTNDSDDPSDGTDADNADTEPNNDPDDPTDINLSGLQDSQMSVIKVGTLDDGGDGLNAGDVINYVITITNTGNTTLTNISIADPGATITSGTPIADLGPGAVATINANHVLTQPEIDSGSYSNQATVTYDDHNGTTLTNDSDDPSDGTDADNADTEPNNDPDDPTDIDLSGLQDSQMSVIKVGTLDDGGDGLNAGDVINYVITITNTGNTTLTNISIADPGATITSGTPIADLGPGAVATINANHVLTQPEIDSGSYSNQATVTYDDHNGTTLTNDSDDPSDGTDADNADTEPNNDPDDPTDIDLSGLQDSQMSVIKVGTLDDGGDGLNAGDVINYVITITNTGNTTLTNISIADPGATITSGTPIADLGPGAVATINANHVLTQPEIDSGSYSNQATVTYDDHNGTTLTNDSDDPSDGTDADNADTEPNNDPDDPTDIDLSGLQDSQMSVIKVGTLDDGGDGLNAGDVINYVITITNTGNTTLTNISIADPGATITSGTPIADLGPGAVATINANHVLTQPEIDSGSYSNQATVTYDDHNGTTLTNDSDDPSDGTDADNADTEPNNDPDDPTDIDLSGLQDSQMSVIKVGTLDDGGDGLNAGDVINYVITITNTGNTTLTNISIADPGATITSGTPITDLGPGAVATINANHVLTQPEIDSGSYSNQATVTYDDHNGTTLTNDSDDPSDGTDADNADTEPNNDPDDPTDINLSGLQDSQMSVIKVGTLDDGGDGLNAGDVINYVITITNTGNTTLTNISIADPGATITSGTPIADLGPGAVATINANHVLTQPEIDSGSYSNQATVTYDDHNGTTLTNDSDDPSDGTDADNADTEPNNDPDDPTDIDLSGLQDSQMSVIKVGTLDDGGDGLNAGDVINYVITITNTGNTTLTNISIADPGATITSGTPIADLGPGAVATINANHVLTQPEIDSGSYSNQATVTYDDHNGTTLTNDSDDPSDGTDADNADTEPNNDPDDPTDIDLSGLQDSQMSVIKVGTLDDGGDGLNAGDVINYVITITNTGNTTLTNISIADPGATITSGTPIADLGPGAVATINANHVLTQPEIDSGSYSNQATVTYDDHNGTTLTNDSDDPSDGTDADNADTEPNNDPDDPTDIDLSAFQTASYSIAKTSNMVVTCADVGDDIIYTVTVQNTGNLSISNIVVNDPLLLTDLVLTSDGNGDAILDVGETWIYTGTYTVTQQVIDDFGIDHNGVADGDGDIDNCVTLNGTRPDMTSLAEEQACTVVSINLDPPVTTQDQYFCSADNPTIEDIIISGTNITWYDAASGGNVLPDTTLLVDGTTYYAAQTAGVCASRTDVTVTLEDTTIEAPDGSDQQFLCTVDNPTLADLIVTPTLPGAIVTFYSIDDSTDQANILPLTTPLVDGTIYYAFQGVGTCAESLAITVTLEDTTIEAPDGSDQQFLCTVDNPTLADLIVTPTLPGAIVTFYSIDDSTDQANILPLTTPLVDGTIYYAFQGVGTCAESLAVTVTLEDTTIEAPDGSDQQFLCTVDNPTLADLIVTPTLPGAIVTFYSVDDSTDQANILPLTTPLVDGTTYYAFQGVGTCAESLAVTVTLEDTTIEAPDGSDQQFLCTVDNPTLADLIVTPTLPGAIVTFYSIDDSTDQANILPLTTPLVDGTTYYAFQGVGTCAESLAITVTLEDTTIEAPDGSDQQFLCTVDNPTLADLIVTPTLPGAIVTFYSIDDSTDQANILPLTTPLVDGTTYYAFQGVGTCAESLAVTVTLEDTTIEAPDGSDQQFLCTVDNPTLADLIVTPTLPGAIVTFYSIDDSTDQANILPLTTPLVDGTTYYAFQGVGTCAESLAVTVTLEDTTIEAPDGSDQQFLCTVDNPTLADLIVTPTLPGAIVTFYSIDDSTDQANILPPTTPLVDGTTYYAFQGVGTCAESLAVTVTLEDTTIEAPDGSDQQFLCTADTPTLADLIVTPTLPGAIVTFYSIDDSTDQANILPLTTPLVDGTTYYAFQGVGTCAESLAVTVTLEDTTIEAPDGSDQQFLCTVDNPTLADLIVTPTLPGAIVTFYSIDDSTDQANILPLTTPLVDGTTYYAFQGVGTCAESLAVTVTLEDTTIEAPDGSDQQFLCTVDNPTLADLIVTQTLPGAIVTFYSIDDSTDQANILPLTTPLVDGTIYYAFQGVGTCAESLAVTVTLEDTTIEAPDGSDQQFLCTVDNPTLADLIVTPTLPGAIVTFYSVDDSTDQANILPLTTPLVDGTTYYAFQGVGTCAESLAVTVTLEDTTIEAPDGSDQQFLCTVDNPTLADLIVTPTLPGAIVTFYSIDDSTDQANILPLTTALVDGTTYYAFQGVGTCAESLAITVTLEDTTIEAPDGSDQQFLCTVDNPTLADLIVTPTLPGAIVTFYSIDDSTDQANILPLTTPLVDGTTYYAFQGVGTCAESLAVTVTLEDTTIEAPDGSDQQFLCTVDNPTLADLIVTPTLPGAIVTFYSIDDSTDQANILPPTTPLVDGTTYYAFQGVGTCAESLAVTVTLEDTTIEAPDGSDQQFLCTADTPTLADLIVTPTLPGAIVTFYSVDDSTDQANILPLTTPLVDGTTYYAFQGVGTCAESLAVTVTLEDTTIEAPDGSDQQFLCTVDNPTLADLIVTPTLPGAIVTFYSIDDSTDQANILPLTTPLVDGTTYYAFQGVGTCAESLAVTVTLEDTTIEAPDGSDQQFLCTVDNPTLADLIVTPTLPGAIVTFYSIDDSTDQANILPLTTALVDGTTYYAFQGVGTCAESLAITVTLEDTTIEAPDGSDQQFLCTVDNPTLADLIVTPTLPGAIVTFYSIDDSTDQANILPLTTPLVDGTTYYAFQGVGTCAESLAVTVTLEDTTIEAPDGSDQQFLCTVDNPTLADLIVTPTLPGAIVTFYSVDDSTDQANILPLTTPLVDGTTYYAFQGVGTCAESLAITVTLEDTTIEAPDGSDQQFLCTVDNPTLADLIVTPTLPGAIVTFYSVDDSTNQANILPLTTPLVDGTTYYAFQGVGTCAESLAVTVTLEDTTIEAPDGSDQQFLCTADTPTLADLIVTPTLPGAIVTFYSVDDSTDQANILPLTTPLVDGTTYYAFQGVGTCAESLAVTVTLEDTTIEAPVGENNQLFCDQDSPTLADLIVTPTLPGAIVTFYSVDDSTDQANTLPLTTALVDGTTYYAFQGVGTCAESLAITANADCTYLEVVKTADVDSVSNIGDEIVYTIEITNNNIIGVTNIVVDDPLVTLTYISGDENNNNVIDFNETWVYQGTYTVTASDFANNGIDSNGNADNDGDIDNEVSVVGTSLSGNDIDEVTDTEEVIINQIADIEITKAGPVYFCNEDEEVQYSIVVTNMGNIDLTNIQISDDNADDITPSVISSLNPGQSVNIIATHIITEADRLNGIIINTATVEATDINGELVTDISDDPNDPTDADADGDGDPDDVTIVLEDSDCDGIPSEDDIDDDNDGIIDIVENEGADPSIDQDGDNVPQYIDDDDNDPSVGNEDGLPQNDSDGDNIPNHEDIDSDNDGIPDNVEGQTTLDYVEPSGNDADGDGLDDAYDDVDSLGIDPEDTDGDTTPDYLDEDSDNDTVLDNIEGHDYNHDGIADNTFEGVDSDNDGLDDGYEGSEVDDPNDVNDEIDLPIIDLPDNDADTGIADGDVDYRDINDDNDEFNTIDEDANANGNLVDDDCDLDNIPDYLDPDPCSFEFPDAFSPNDDNDNNEFYIDHLVNLYPDFRLEIYDRYGLKVFEYQHDGTNREPEWWNGYSNGRWTISPTTLVPVGTYFYILYPNREGVKANVGWVYVSY